MTPAREPRPVAEIYADVIAAVVDQAPPLTPAQRDRLAVLLRPYLPHVPTPRAPIPVTSAGPASLGFSAAARATRPEREPQRPAQRQERPLRRPGFRATPEATS